MLRSIPSIGIFADQTPVARILLITKTGERAAFNQLHEKACAVGSAETSLEGFSEGFMKKDALLSSTTLPQPLASFSPPSQAFPEL